MLKLFCAHFLPIFLIVILIPFTVRANDPEIAFNSAEEIPFVLREELKRSYAHDDYIKTVPTLMMLYTNKLDGFTKSDLEEAIQKALIKKKNRK